MSLLRRFIAWLRSLFRRPVVAQRQRARAPRYIRRHLAQALTQKNRRGRRARVRAIRMAMRASSR